MTTFSPGTKGFVPVHLKEYKRERSISTISYVDKAAREGAPTPRGQTPPYSLSEKSTVF